MSGPPPTWISQLSALVQHKRKVYSVYRSYILLWMLGGLAPLMVMFVWAGVVDQTELGTHQWHHGDIYSYFALLFLVRQLTTVWVHEDLAAEIDSGDIARRLSTPMLVGLEFVAGHLIGVAFRLLPSIAMLICIVQFGAAWPSFHWSRLPYFCASLAIAWGIQYSILWIVGTCSLWINDIRSLSSLLSASAYLLGGGIAPLVFLPEAALVISKYTPFPYLISSPIEALLPQFSIQSVLANLLAGSLWLAALALLATTLWHRSIRSHSLLGG